MRQIPGFVPLVALFLSIAIPQAALSSEPTEAEAEAESVVAPETSDEQALSTEQVDVAVSEKDADAATDATKANSIAQEAQNWVCRKEKPTGSHKTIKVCRRAEDIEDSVAEVERVMNRQKQYGNPSITPPG